MHAKCMHAHDRRPRPAHEGACRAHAPGRGRRPIAPAISHRGTHAVDACSYRGSGPGADLRAPRRPRWLSPGRRRPRARPTEEGIVLDASVLVTAVGEDGAAGAIARELI